MAKTKDGFYKQTGSLTGSDNLILLAGGGTTTLSYYTPFTVYSYSNGCLVKTDIPTESNTMVTFRIEGNSYGNNSILTTGNFYNYKDNNQILNATAYHHGYNFGKITVFCYNNYVHLWFKQPSNYQSFVVTVYATNGTPNNTNRITSISNQAIPTSGVTRSVEITPVVDSVAGDGSYLTVKIGNVTKTLTIPSSLKNPNAIKFKNTAGTEVSYDGSSAVDLTGGINYATKSNYSKNLLGRTTEGTDYDDADGNLIFAEWNTYNDNRWYLKATGYSTRVGYANDSDLLDGLHLNSTTRNNEANKVMRTDASGYANFGWINTTSGTASGTITRIYCSQDSYVRYLTPANTLVAMISTLSEGTSNVTDNTEILTSYASNNGFADTNAPNVVYKRDALCIYNYIKGKLDSVYQPKGDYLTSLPNHNHNYLTAYGEAGTASVRTADYTTALCTGGWSGTDKGYGSYYGTTLDVSGYSTWYHRLAFRTDGKIEYWQGINTKTLTKQGILAFTSNIPTKVSQLTNDSCFVTGGPYLPLIGGTLKNGTERSPLILDTTATTEVGLRLAMSGTVKSWIGYSATYGTYLYNSTRQKYLNYKDDGNLQFEGNTVYHSGNLTKSTLGLGNVQNTAFYLRVTTVNGTAWNMAGTTNGAAFTIYAPTTAGTSGQVLTSTAGTPGWTNQSSLSVGSAKKLLITSTSTSSVNSCYEDLKVVYYTLAGCTADSAGKRYAGTADTYGFNVTNNANGILWVGTHSGNYGHQLGFSSDGRIYDRAISAGTFPTTANGGSWNKIAWVSDLTWSNISGKPTIPTVTNYYWANVKVSSTSNTATKPTFGETNISGGLLKITNSSNTTTIGSQNVSFCHIYNSASIPFIVNNSLLSTSGNLGNTTYRWEDLYLKKLIDINYSTGSTDIGTKVTGSTYSIGFIVGSGNTNRGIYDYTNSKWIIYKDATTTYVPSWASLGSTYAPVYFNSTGKPIAATSYAKAIKTITRSGTTFTYTCIDGTTGTFTQQDNNTTYNVFGKTINASFKTAYRTQTKGNTSQGYYIAAIRNDTSSVTDSPIYGSGLAFGMADTHGYLYLNYNAVEAYLGAGNADKLNWVKKLAFADGTGASGTWAISVSGNAATSSRLKILDLRDTNHLPNSSNYPAKHVTGWFNSTGTPNSEWYSGLTIKGWDNTYQTWQIASGSTTAIHERMYYRCGITNSSGTATWNSWKQIAFVTDISNHYWANVKISSASSTTTTPTFGASVRLNSSITGAGGNVALELFRGTNASWKMDNNAGWLRFQCNYTTTVVDYYTVFSLEYNTKKATFQGDVTAPNFIGVASKVTCTEGSGNYDRAVVVTNTTNQIFYTNKLKINYSTGKITATNSIYAASFYESSDRNLKENIQVLSNDLLDKVYNVKEVSFNWKKTKSQAFGYIAQDFETISETFIGRNDDGTLSLNYTEVLVAQIAALKQKIANLEKRIQVLDSKN